MDSNNVRVAQGELSPEFKDELINSSSLKYNVGQEFITVSREKVELILIKNINKISSKLLFLTPLSVFLTVLLSLLTAEFRDRFGLGKDVWFAFYIMCGIFSLGFCIYLSVKAYKARKITIDSIVEQFFNIARDKTS